MKRKNKIILIITISLIILLFVTLISIILLKNKNVCSIINNERLLTQTTNTIKDAISQNGILSTTNNTAVKDDDGNTIIIPVGFKLASDSATNQKDGIVIEDKDGNQFVWIPVTDISKYSRTDFGKQYGNYSDYSEKMPLDEKISVTKYHGFYIGRYEAGDNVSTNGKAKETTKHVSYSKDNTQEITPAIDGQTLRSKDTSTTNNVGIKSNEAPYNYITFTQAENLAEKMNKQEGYKAITKLCSSYAWDTAISFIQNKVTDYGQNSQGNYHDISINYIDITGNKEIKVSGSNQLIPTGGTTPVCNIYDMGGNEWEWTTENIKDKKDSRVVRGGYYSNNYEVWSAGSRSSISENSSDDHTGFRVTLYI